MQALGQPEAGVSEKRREQAGGQAGMPEPGAESRGKPAAEPTAAERRAEALRANLRRRQAQARARGAPKDGESPPRH